MNARAFFKTKHGACLLSTELPTFGLGDFSIFTHQLQTLGKTEGNAQGFHQELRLCSQWQRNTHTRPVEGPFAKRHLVCSFVSACFFWCVCKGIFGGGYIGWVLNGSLLKVGLPKQDSIFLLVSLENQTKKGALKRTSHPIWGSGKRTHPDLSRLM